MRVLSLAGSPRIPSRSAALLQLSQRWLQQQQVEVLPYTLHDFQAEDLLRANFNSPDIKAFTAQLATGGSIGHMLAVDYALKPVLTALKAQEVLHGVFADDGQIVLSGEQAQLSEGVAARLTEALESFYLALSRRKPPVPHPATSLLTRQTA